MATQGNDRAPELGLIRAELHASLQEGWTVYILHPTSAGARWVEVPRDKALASLLS